MNSPLNVGEKSDSGNKDLNPPKTDSISPYAVPGVSLPTVEESNNDDACETGHAIADLTTNSPTTLPRGKLTPVLDENEEDTRTTLTVGDIKETFDMNNKLTDVEVWNDDCPLPSTGHTCSEWQNTDYGNSSGFGDISTEVLTAGCLPQCEEPRSGCVNIESVMPSEQVSHLPTSINEDDTNIVGNDGFLQLQNKVEGNLSLTEL